MHFFPADAVQWTREALEQARSFDVIQVDSTDFGAGGPLHYAEFYDVLAKLLSEKGVLVVNLTSLSWDLPHAKAGVELLR